MKLKKSVMGFLWVLILIGVFSRSAHAAGTYTVKFNETLQLYLSGSRTITSASWSSSDARIVKIISSDILSCKVMGVDNQYGTSATITCNYTYLLAGRAFRSSERFTVRVPSDTGSGGGGTGNDGPPGECVLDAYPSSVTLDLAGERERKVILSLSGYYPEPGGYGADLAEDSCVRLLWGQYFCGSQNMTVVANKVGSQKIVVTLYKHTDPVRVWGRITVPVQVICSHSYGQSKEICPATKDSPGLVEKTCQYCKKTVTEKIPRKETPKPETPKNNGSSAGNPSSAKNVLTDSRTKTAYVVVKKNNTVWYKGPANKNITKALIPAVVKLKGRNYKVTGISDKAFRGCKKLKTVSVGKNVTYIGKEAFKNCGKITRFAIPTKVSQIGAQAFYGCSELKFITIKTDKLTKRYVGAKAFKGIHPRAVIKAPRQKRAVYKRLLKARGVGKKTKVN